MQAQNQEASVSAQAFEQAEREFLAQYDLVEIPENVLGEGTYGTVYKARCRRTGQTVAMKKMKLGQSEDGVPSTAIREIAVLKELPHQNVVQLRDVFCKPEKLLLVFEYLEMDLKKYMKEVQKLVKGGQLMPSVVKTLSQQLCRGIEFCHKNRVIHRDLKPQNLLLDSADKNRPIMKIADFGLARAYSVPLPEYTHEVVTVWYRPPEILLGSKIYSIPVDLWGIGCVIAEMATGQPLFCGDSEIDTIFKIFQKLGTPTDEQWPALPTLPDFKRSFPKWPHRRWENIRNMQAQVGAEGIDLVEKMLAYDPTKRISARESLTHSYFRDLPRGS
eukprot:TRINITY_DN120745_c0_g1_i1.p1 TRINITY_DN120745_c0_g1~~TRINITY_DN120745_c0_g1_i1.p1  ORF type:complete len:331 (-),score=79.80 TRINITY_DN120745_c0_g1_i1:225-1217(-)